MKLEDQVVSLELAKRLKELGVKQESTFCWLSQTPFPDTKWKIYSTGTSVEEWVDGHHIAAFTVAELGARLPCMVSIGFKVYEIEFTHPTQKQWNVTYKSSAGWLKTTSWHTEADARAKMLIYLIEDKFIKI